jgi:hypothetical protein
MATVLPFLKSSFLSRYISIYIMANSNEIVKRGVLKKVIFFQIAGRAGRYRLFLFIFYSDSS